MVANNPSDNVARQKQHSRLGELATRMVRTKPLGTLGALITLILLLTGIFANFLAPYGVNQAHALHALEGPSAQFLLGTDNLGRDLLSRIIFGARVSVIVGLSAALISTIISTSLGTISAYIGGSFDLIVQRFVDAVMCIPSLILLMVIISIIGTGMWQVIVCLGISSGIGGSRMIRSLVISVKENTYVQSAVALGAPTGKILIQHILPNIMAQIIIIFTMTVPSMILAEASLSFLGYGIRPPNASWGAMLSGSTRQYMLLAPWMALWPGLALSTIVYGVSMFGDALRDLLDPRLRGGIGRYGSKINKKKIAKNDRIAPEANT